MDLVPLVDYRLMDLDAGKYKRQVRVERSMPHRHVYLCIFDSQIEHYEYYWALRKGQLDLDTPLNHLPREALSVTLSVFGTH